MIANAEEFKEKLSHLGLTPSYKSKEGQHYRVEVRSGSYDTTFPIDGDFEIRLGEENRRMAFFYDFQSRYPYLHPYVDKNITTLDFGISSLWVNRNGRDAEAIPGPVNRTLWRYTEEEFIRYNEEARKANQKDWFFCSNCGIAKPISEYAYFHFAGKYCKKCKDEDPAAYRAAMNENYE